jgi:hypothetical protein
MLSPRVNPIYQFVGYFRGPILFGALLSAEASLSTLLTLYRQLWNWLFSFQLVSETGSTSVLSYVHFSSTVVFSNA